MAPEIVRHPSRLQMGKHQIAAFHDGDAEAEIYQRHGDLHAQKARAQHHSTLRTGHDLAPDRLTFGLVTQVMDPRQARALDREALRTRARRDQKSPVADTHPRRRHQDLRCRVQRDRFRVQRKLYPLLAVEAFGMEKNLFLGQVSQHCLERAGL